MRQLATDMAIMDKKRALGRGLESLIPAARQVAPVVREVIKEVPAAGDQVLDIAVGEIEPSPYQPRINKDEAKLKELADSIRATGVLQPIVVREVTAGIARPAPSVEAPGEPRRGTPPAEIPGAQHRPPANGEATIRYQLIAGERRWLASMLAGKETVPAIVRKMSNEQAAEMSLVENLQREDLDPMEMARAFARLSSEFGLTQEQIAARTGKERTTIANHMRLLKLPGQVQVLIASGKVSFGHAKVLLTLPNQDAVIAIMEEIVARDLSVRQTEELAKQHLWEAPKEDTAAPAPAKWTDPNVKEAERQLQAALGTRVHIIDKHGRGKVVIEYKTLEDFDRILEALGK